MKDKIIDFFLNHGFKIMLFGFSLSAVGVIIYIKTQKMPGRLRELGGALVAVGIGFYIIGRISVIGERRRARKERMLAAKESSEKEKA